MPSPSPSQSSPPPSPPCFQSQISSLASARPASALPTHQPTHTTTHRRPSTAPIVKVDAQTSHSIRAAHTILDPAAIVKELLENALDAKATRIDIRLRGTAALDSITVSDNGQGISPADFHTLCTPSTTSKLSDMADMHSLASFGFRGEALSAICSVAASVSVRTRTSSDESAALLVFSPRGELISNTRVARPVGTTISVTDVFHNLPVRRVSAQRAASRELSRCVAVAQSLALVSPVAHIELRHGTHLKVRSAVPSTNTKMKTKTKTETENEIDDDNNSNTESTSATEDPPDFIASLRTSAGALLGARAAASLLELRADSLAVVRAAPAVPPALRDSRRYSVRGLVSSAALSAEGGGGRARSPHQYLYVNGRPVDMPRIVRVANEVYRRATGASSTAPMLVLDFVLPAWACDVNLAPDKRAVLVHEEDALVAGLQCALELVWMPTREMSIPVRPQSSVLSTFASAPDAKADAEVPRSSRIDEGANDDEDKDDDDNGGDDADTPGVQARDAGHILDTMIGIANSPREQLFGSGHSPDAPKGASPSRAPDAQPLTPRVADTDGNANDSDMGKDALAELSPPRSPPPSPPSTGPTLLAALNGLRRGAPARPRPRPPKLDNSRAPSRRGARGEGDYRYSQSQLEERVETVSHARLLRMAGSKRRHASDDSVNGPRALRGYSDGGGCDEGGGAIPGGASDVARGGDRNYSLLDDARSKRPRRVVQVEGAVLADEGAGVAAEGTEETAAPVNVLMDGPREGGGTGAPEDVVSADWEGIWSGATRARRRRRRAAMHGAGRTGAFDKASVKGAIEQIALERDVQQEAADMELSRQFRQEWFSEVRVVGQFNRGFIVGRLDKDMFIIDQHASDEKFNFERLQVDAAITRQKLVRPLRLEFSAEDELLVKQHLAAFRAGGFDLRYCEEREPTRRLLLLSQPVRRRTMFVQDDLRDIVDMLRTNVVGGGVKVLRPPRERAVFATKACRMSIMIGRALGKKEMETVVGHLAEIEHPWTCPHGRPTMRHLLRLPDSDNVGDAIDLW